MHIIKNRWHKNAGLMNLIDSKNIDIKKLSKTINYELFVDFCYDCLPKRK